MAASGGLQAVGMGVAMRGTAVRQTLRAAAGTITGSAQVMNSLVQLPVGRRALGLAFLAGAGFYIVMLVLLLLFLFICLKAIAAYYTAMETQANNEADYEEDRLKRFQTGADDAPLNYFDAQDQFDNAIVNDYATTAYIDQATENMMITLVIGAAAGTFTSIGGAGGSIIGFVVDGIVSVGNYYLWAATPLFILGLLFAATGTFQAQSAAFWAYTVPFIVNFTSFTNYILFGLLGMALLIWQGAYGIIVSAESSAVYAALLPIRIFFACAVNLIPTIIAELGNVFANFLLAISFWLSNPIYMEIPLLNTFLAIGQLLETVLGSPVLCICFVLWYIVGGVFKIVNSYYLAYSLTSAVNFVYITLMVLVVRPVISLIGCIESEFEHGTCPNFTRPSVYRLWQLETAAVDNFALFIQNATVWQFDIWINNGTGLLPCQVNGSCAFPTDAKQWLVRFLRTNYAIAVGNAIDVGFAAAFDVLNIIFNVDQVFAAGGNQVFTFNYTYYEAITFTTNFFSILNTLPYCSNGLVSAPGIPFSNLGYLVAAAINVVYIIETCLVGEIYTLLTPPSQVPGYFSAQFLLSNNPLMTNYAAWFAIFANSFGCIVAFVDPYIGQSLAALLQAVIVYAPQVPIRLLLYIRYVLQYPEQSEILNNIDINQLEGLLINSTVLADIFFQFQPGATQETCPNSVNFGCGLGLGVQYTFEAVIYFLIANLKSVIKVLILIILSFIPGNSTQIDKETANVLVATSDYNNANISAYNAGCKLGVAIGTLLPLDIPCLTSLNTSNPGVCAIVEYPGQQYASISVCLGTMFCKIGDLLGVPVEIVTLLLSQLFGAFTADTSDSTQTFIYVINQVFTIVFSRVLAWVCPTAHVIDCVLSVLTGLQDTTVSSMVCLIMGMFLFVLDAIEDFIIGLITLAVNVIVFVFGGFASNNPPAGQQIITIFTDILNLVTVDIVQFITSLLNLALSILFVIIQGLCYAVYYLTFTKAFPYSDCENLVTNLENLVNPGGTPGYNLNPSQLWKKRSATQGGDSSTDDTTTPAQRVMTAEEAEIFHKTRVQGCLALRNDEISNASNIRVFASKTLSHVTKALNELYRRNPSLVRWPLEYGDRVRQTIEESQLQRDEETAKTIAAMRRVKREVEATAEEIANLPDDHPRLGKRVFAHMTDGERVILIPERNDTNDSRREIHGNVINDAFVQDALNAEFGKPSIDPQFLAAHMHANVSWAAGSDCNDLMRLLRHEKVDNMSASDFLAIRNCVRMKSIAVVMQAAFPFLYIPEDLFYNTLMRVSVFGINLIRVLTCVTQWGSDRTVPVARLFDRDYQKFWDDAGMSITVYSEIYGKHWHGNATTEQDEIRINHLREQMPLTTYLRRNFPNLYALVQGFGNLTAEADSIDADPLLGPISRMYTTTTGMMYDTGMGQMAQNEAYINASEASPSRRNATRGSSSSNSTPYDYSHATNDYGPAAINAHRYRMEMVDSQVKFFRWVQKVVNYFIGFYRATFVQPDPNSRNGDTPWDLGKRALPTILSAAYNLPSTVPQLVEQVGESWARRVERMVYYSPAFQDKSILLDYNPHLGGGIISTERNDSVYNGSALGVLFGPRNVSRFTVGLGSLMELAISQFKLNTIAVMPWCMEIVANMTGRTYGEVYAQVAHTNNSELAQRMRAMCSDHNWKARMQAFGIDPEGEFGSDPWGYATSIFRADGDGARRAREFVSGVFQGIGNVISDSLFLLAGDPIDPQLDSVGNMILRHSGLRDRRMPPPSWVAYAAEGKLDRMPPESKRDADGDASTSSFGVGSFAARKLGVQSLQNKLDQCDADYQTSGYKDPGCRLTNLRHHIRNTPTDILARDGIPWEVMDRDISEMTQYDRESVAREFFVGSSDPKTAVGRWRQGIMATLQEMNDQNKDREKISEILHPKSSDGPLAHFFRERMTDIEATGENGMLFRPTSRLYRTLLSPPGQWNASGVMNLDRHKKEFQEAWTFHQMKTVTRKMTADAPLVRIYRKMYVVRAPGGDLIQLLPHRLRAPPTGWMEAMIAMAEMRSDGERTAFATDETPVIPRDPEALLNMVLKGAQGGASGSTRTSNANYANVNTEAHGRTVHLVSAIDYQTRSRMGGRTPTAAQRSANSDATLQSLLRQSGSAGPSADGFDPLMGVRFAASHARRADAKDVARLMGEAHASRFGAQQLEYAARKMEIYVLENVASDVSSSTFGGFAGEILADIGTLFNKTCYTGVQVLCDECLAIDNIIGVLIRGNQWTTLYYQTFFPVVVNEVASFFEYTFYNSSTVPARSGYGGLNSPWLPAINQSVGSMFQLFPEEVEYGISFVRWIENIVGNAALPWVRNGPLYQTVLNYTNELSYSIQNNKPYAIVAIYSALSFVEFDLGWEVCELIDSLASSGESYFGLVGFWAYYHLLYCGYTHELDCTQQQYSFTAGLIVEAAYMLALLIAAFAISLPLGMNGTVLPPLATFLVIFFFPIHALITYNWSLGCIIFPMCYLPDAYDLFIYSIFPKCPWWIGGWVLNDDYSPLNCQNMSMNWTYVNCPNAGFMTVFDATRYADLALGWNITPTLENTFVATIYSLFWGRLESSFDFASSPWNTSQALYRTNAWCTIATAVPGAIGAVALALIAGGPFLFIVAAVPSTISITLDTLSEVFDLVVLVIRSMQDSSNRITNAMKNIRMHKRRKRRAELQRTHPNLALT